MRLWVKQLDPSAVPPTAGRLPMDLVLEEPQTNITMGSRATWPRFTRCYQSPPSGSEHRDLTPW